MELSPIIFTLPSLVPALPATNSIRGHTLVWHLYGTRPSRALKDDVILE